MDSGPEGENTCKAHYEKACFRPLHVPCPRNLTIKFRPAHKMKQRRLNRPDNMVPLHLSRTSAGVQQVERIVEHRRAGEPCRTGGSRAEEVAAVVRLTLGHIRLHSRAAHQTSLLRHSMTRRDARQAHSRRTPEQHKNIFPCSLSRESVTIAVLCKRKTTPSVPQPWSRRWTSARRCAQTCPASSSAPTTGTSPRYTPTRHRSCRRVNGNRVLPVTYNTGTLSFPVRQLRTCTTALHPCTHKARGNKTNKTKNRVVGYEEHQRVRNVHVALVRSCNDTVTRAAPPLRPISKRTSRNRGHTCAAALITPQHEANAAHQKHVHHGARQIETSRT